MKELLYAASFTNANSTLGFHVGVVVCDFCQPQVDDLVESAFQSSA